MSRNEEILAMYKNGKTLEEIGINFRVSRARIQQVVVREMEKEILLTYRINPIEGEEKRLLKFVVKQEVEKIIENRKAISLTKKLNTDAERIKNKIQTIHDPTVFRTLADFARALNEKPELLKLHVPEIVEKILQDTKKRWSRFYFKCRKCSTSALKHKSYGYCVRCWPKSDLFKQSQKNSFLRNIEKRREQNRRYSKQYLKRPEVQERMKKRHDIQAFGGNRELALIRDGYKCQSCGITAEKSNTSLMVKHLGDKLNHELSNLKTVCRSCHSQSISKKGLAKIKLLQEARNISKKSIQEQLI